MVKYRSNDLHLQKSAQSNVINRIDQCRSVPLENFSHHIPTARTTPRRIKVIHVTIRPSSQPPSINNELRKASKILSDVSTDFHQRKTNNWRDKEKHIVNDHQYNHKVTSATTIKHSARTGKVGHHEDIMHNDQNNTKTIHRKLDQTELIGDNHRKKEKKRNRCACQYPCICLLLSILICLLIGAILAISLTLTSMNSTTTTSMTTTMTTDTTTITAEPLLYGPLMNFSLTNLSSAWSLCYSAVYATPLYPNISAILSTCYKDKLLLGCRPVGSTLLTLAAMGNRTDVLYNCSASNTLTHQVNGIGWYFAMNTASWNSWGFVYGSDSVVRGNCDGDMSTNPAYRLCWHMTLGGGWRCGSTGNLDTSTSWEKLIYHAM